MNAIRFTLRICFLLILFLGAGCEDQERKPAAEPVSISPQYQGTIIAVGNSLTAGLGVSERNAWPSLVQNKLREEGYSRLVINAGISGETSSALLRRIKWILSQKPDIIILESGANDGLRGIPIPVIKDNISKAVQMLQEGDVTVILAGMQIVQNLGPLYTESFAAIYSEIAGERQCLLIPFLLQGVAGKVSLNQEDTIHPNEEGHSIIARTVYPFVLQALQTE